MMALLLVAAYGRCALDDGDAAFEAEQVILRCLLEKDISEIGFDDRLRVWRHRGRFCDEGVFDEAYAQRLLLRGEGSLPLRRRLDAVMGGVFERWAKGYCSPAQAPRSDSRSGEADDCRARGVGHCGSLVCRTRFW